MTEGETKIREEFVKQVVREAFKKTQEIIGELGWSGSSLGEGGALKKFVNPQTGERSKEYVDDYPINLTEFSQNTELLDPDTLAYLNLAVIWSIARRDYKDNPSVFSGKLGRLEGNPKFKLALMLVENPNYGKIFQDLINTDGSFFEQKLHNGEGGKNQNPNLPHFTADEIKKTWPDASLPEGRQNFSPWEVIKLIEQAK